MMTAHDAIAHVLAFILLVAGPAWDYWHTPRWKNSQDPRAKLREYKILVAALWISSGLALYAAGREIFSLHILSPHIAQLHHPKVAWAYCAAAAVLAIAMVLLPHFQALSGGKARQRIMKHYDLLAFFLPKTSGEYRWFGVLAVSAGFCEEVLFRGFLIGYFGAEPWRLGFLAAVALAALAFGANHLYQGAKEIPTKAFAGFIFSGLYLVTGSLWVPVAVHMITDLMAIPVLKKATAQE
jgi:uncharacterized protein